MASPQANPVAGFERGHWRESAGRPLRLCRPIATEMNLPINTEPIASRHDVQRDSIPNWDVSGSAVSWPSPEHPSRQIEVDAIRQSQAIEMAFRTSHLMPDM